MRFAAVITYLFFVSTVALGKSLYVSAGGNADNTLSFNSALQKAKPGDTIFLKAGKYTGTYNLVLRGTETAPIRIVGQDSNVIFDGQMLPQKSGGSCLYIEKSKWLIFENFKMRNCWSSAIKVFSSQHLVFKNLDIQGGRFAIKAGSADTQFLTIEDSHWNQDPSGRLWKELSWEEAHHGKFSYFNGSILGADGIAGDIIIRRNLIENAYNGIRMKGHPGKVKSSNANVEIYENVFRRIRDNPIEPEISAYNWWIHHNRIENAHAWISLTEVSGGEIYIFGNVGWTNESYGVPGDHNGGTVLKFEVQPPYPTLPIYVFNNSWYVQDHANYIRPLTPTRNLVHANNAIFILNPKASTLTQENFDTSYSFAHDLLNINPEAFAKKHWINLIVADPDFMDAKNGDFRLKKHSAAIDRGKILSFEKWTSQYDGKAPDIGAYEGSKLFIGPKFVRK